MSGLVKQIMF